MAFTVQDLTSIRSRAVGNYARFLPRSRLDGMTRDLNDEDIRILSIYEASIVFAYERLGGVRPGPEELEALFPKVFQEINQCVESDSTSYNVTEQK